MIILFRAVPPPTGDIQIYEDAGNWLTCQIYKSGLRDNGVMNFRAQLVIVREFFGHIFVLVDVCRNRQAIVP